MLLSVRVCGRRSLLHFNLFIPNHKIMNERHTDSGNPTIIPTSNHNMEHDKRVKSWHFLYSTEKVYGNISNICI